MLGMLAMSSTRSTLTQEQQKQVNLLALEVAKDLSPSASWQNNHATAEIINHLAQKGWAGEAKMIPHLIDGLKLPDKGLAGLNSLRSLTMMTRRMRGALCGSGPEYSLHESLKSRTLIIAWWENWWKQNEKKHPIYDTKIDQQLRSEFLHLCGLIEDKLKPGYPELAFFTTQTNVSLPALGWLSVLYEYQYDPRHNAISPLHGGKPLKWEDLPWPEIACRFQGEEMPTAWEQHTRRKPPERMASILTTVYSKNIEGSAIFVEVRIASPNKKLAEDLEKLLAP